MKSNRPHALSGDYCNLLMGGVQQSLLCTEKCDVQSFYKPTMLLAVQGLSVILNSSSLTLCPFLNIYKSSKRPEALINDNLIVMI